MSANVVLVRWPGGWREVPNIPDGRLRREMPLGISATSEAEVDRVGLSQIRILGDIREEITAKIDPKTDADRFGLGFDIADRMGVADHTGTVASQRIMSVTCTWDGQKVDSIPQFKDIILGEQQRFSQIVTKQTQGAAAGMTRAPQPVSAIVTGGTCCPPEYKPVCA